MANIELNDIFKKLQILTFYHFPPQEQGNSDKEKEKPLALAKESDDFHLAIGSEIF